MLTWRLWRSLHRSQMKHPFFRYIFQRSQIRPDTLNTQAREGIIRALPVLVGLVACGMIAYTRQIPDMNVLLPLVILGVNLISGLRYTSGIATRIVEERETSRYELVQVTPGGRLYIHWALALDWFDRQPRLWIVLLTTSIVCLFLLSFAVPARANPLTLLASLAVWCAVGLPSLAAVLLVEYIHTHMLAILVGILAALDVQTRWKAQTRGAGLFLGAQVTLYLLAVGIGGLGANALRGTGLALVWVGGVVVGVFVVREVLIVLIWRYLQRHLESDPLGVSVVLRGDL